MSVKIKNPLAKQLFFFGFLPTILLLLLTISLFLFTVYQIEYNRHQEKLKSLAERVASQVEHINARSLSTVKTMALSQVSGLFGDRKRSSEYAKQVLIENIEYTGTDFGYEPNSDQSDFAFLSSFDGQAMLSALDEKGRFLPYWYRDENNHVVLAPLIDMETSMYYQGLKDLFIKSQYVQGLVTEPYIYQGKMIVEYVYPIVINGKFKGMAGIDRALTDIDVLLKEMSADSGNDIFLISSRNNIIAVNNDDYKYVLTQNIEETLFNSTFVPLLKKDDSIVGSFIHPIDDEEHLYNKTKIVTGGWQVVVTHSLSALTAPIWKRFIILFSIVILTLLLVGFLINRALQHFSSRISLAVDVSLDLSQGEIPQNYPLNIEGKDEIALLNESFNAFVERYITINKTCLAIASGDFTQHIAPKSSNDMLAISLNTASVQRMEAEAYLIDQKEKAEVANRAKNEFLSMVSHELRTPLTSINGSLELLQSGIIVGLPQQADELLTIAHNNCARLIRIINDILDVEKMSAGKMEIHKSPTNLKTVIENAIKANKSYAEKYSIEYKFITALDESTVFVDAARIGQVLDNLLSNAAKFSPANAIVKVLLEEFEQHVYVSVIDSGLGIDDDFKTKVFSKFAQADSTDQRQKGGTGLGLSISKSIVELHDGKISFKNNPSKGATFWFELPLFQKEETKLINNKNFRHNVLICEDDPDVAKLISLMLANQGVSSDIALTAEQARNSLKTHHYDAMTLDLVLPDEDGFVFLSELREMKSAEELPIIIVSGLQVKDGVEDEIKSLALDWLNKPIDSKKLLSVVNEALSNQSNGKESPPHILHVEDEKDICLLVEKILPNEYTLTSVGTISAAKKALTSSDFSLILLDLGLPDGNGIEIIKAVQDADFDIPIVIFSAQELNISDYQGVSHFLKSKIKIEDLIGQINTLLSENKYD